MTTLGSSCLLSTDLMTCNIKLCNTSYEKAIYDILRSTCRGRSKVNRHFFFHSLFKCEKAQLQFAMQITMVHQINNRIYRYGTRDETRRDRQHKFLDTGDNKTSLYILFKYRWSFMDTPYSKVHYTHSQNIYRKPSEYQPVCKKP